MAAGASGSRTSTGPSWPGFSKIKHMVIFGDSYSAVGYDNDSPHPTREDPLGVPFPGVTWAEEDEPNWVGHLVTNYSPNPELRVYCYAVGGDRVWGVVRQVRQYSKSLALKPEWAPWNANDTLFVTWVGINDCAWSSEHSDTVEALFELQEKLYNSGARNFLFIDVPPMHRTPAGIRFPDKCIKSNNDWNTNLRISILKFHTAHPDISAFKFSAFQSFTRILDNPSVVGGSGVWLDHIHPTTRTHDVIARDVSEFLNGIQASE